MTPNTSPVPPQEREQPLRCAYCGRERHPGELCQATVWRNYRQASALYCADQPCAQYAQMAAEG